MENNGITGNQQQPQSAPYPPLQQQPQPPPSPAAFNLLQQQQQHQNQQLQLFWNYQRQEIASINDFKNHQLPLARIKKIMKADEDVRMISAEAPVLFAKACELFILELTIRSWLHSEENKRRTLQKNDIAAAIFRTDIFDFLVDIVPRDEALTPDSGVAVVPQVAGGMPFYYPPPTTTPTAGMMFGGPAVDPSMLYAPSQAWRSVWEPAGGGEDETYGDGGNGGEVGNLDG